MKNAGSRQSTRKADRDMKILIGKQSSGVAWRLHTLMGHCLLKYTVHPVHACAVYTVSVVYLHLYTASVVYLYMYTVSVIYLHMYTVYLHISSISSHVHCVSSH